MLKKTILSSPFGPFVRKSASLIRIIIQRLKGNYTNLAHYISALPDKSQIVQIGSNDGRTGDPIYDLINHKQTWDALLVEPIPYLFDRLKANYGTSPRLKFANVAIKDTEDEREEIPFFFVDPRAKEIIPDLPAWYDQLGSFSREHAAYSPIGELIKPYIKETQVNCATLRELMNVHEIKRIDLLHIDAEGYDWKILSQLDLSEAPPKVILYEHKCLTNTEKSSARRFLQEHYSLYELGGDTLAIRKHANKAVQSTLWSLRSKRLTDL
jgi:FkbM family methyltransferase